MTDRPSHVNSIAGQMVFWLGVQLLLLGMGVFQVPMYDGDKANHAPQWMIGGQMVMMSLIFGQWMDRWGKVGIWIATIWPMGVLAGLLAGGEIKTMLAGEFYVSIWFIILGLWRWIGKEAKEGVLGLLGGLTTLGLGLLAYLNSEFGTSVDHGWKNKNNFGPLTEGLWLLEDAKLHGASFLIYSITITGVIALFLMIYKRKNRREKE